MESSGQPTNVPGPSGAVPPGNMPGPIQKPPKDYSKLVSGLIGLGALTIAAVALWWAFGTSHSHKGLSSSNSKTSQTAATQTIPQTTAENTQGIQLDTSKNYGDKYASGLLPVGDGKYVTSAAKAGYIYACSGYANNIQTEQGGAGQRGPWFVGTTKYDVKDKISVRGAVKWQASFSDQLTSKARTIITNDLPNHTTGVFPISAADPAYAYDRNPNSIQGQTFTYSLSAAPQYGSPSCESGQVGIMLTGVALFNGFDAGGRDAGAWEVQDSCDGHPQSSGIYHYHTLSACIKNISVKTVIGFALDGFPITGPQVGSGNFLTTADLDECHGLTSQVVLDGKTVTTYHYVMTQDFPYSISCFRGTPIQPPGEKQPGGPNQKP